MTSTTRKQESWSVDTMKASVLAGSMCKSRDCESSTILSELFLLEFKTNKPNYKKMQTSSLTNIVKWLTIITNYMIRF